ncbi:MAG: hypothetical protein WDN26_10940 [Chitinophagaceae bacterium]
MSIRWKIFRVVCILQIIAAGYIILSSLIRFFEHALFSNFARMLLFLLIISLAILAVNLLNNNYPDTPVAGKQKRSFNILFLLNFLFLAFLFGFIIAEYRELKEIATLLRRSWLQLPFSFLLPIIVYIITLIFQFIILYGLYLLRRKLYENFMKRKFEFEGA